MKNSLIRAIEKIVKPLALLMVGRGVPHNLVSESLKTALVAVAVDKYGEGTSDSRVSLMTGVHRKDVRRLRSEPHNLLDVSKISIPAQVIGKWLGTPAACDPSGRPKPLFRKTKTKREPSFEDLVRTVSVDVRPRSVLDELISRQVVSLDDDDRVTLHPERLVENQTEETATDFLAMNIHDHFTVAVNNCLNESPKGLERCVFYHGLSPEAAQQLARRSETLAMEMLMSINSEAQKLIAQKKNHGECRINLGVYFHQQPIEDNRSVGGKS